MALANFAAYKSQYTNVHQLFDYHRDGVGVVNYNWMSGFSHASAKQFPISQGGINFITAPTTATACDSSTSGALIRPQAGSGDQIIVGAFIQSANNDTGLMLIDRLSHQGGLSGTVTTSQTTNLPTAALTRYTSGVGVYAALEVYTAIGATNATWTVVYTNQAGTGSRSVTFILDLTPSLGSFIPIPLQGTDTGVKSVESLTLTPSTGTAGNFGITLYKPLAWIPAAATRLNRPNDIFDIPGWNEPILDGACLQPLQKSGRDGVASVQASLLFGES